MILIVILPVWLLMALVVFAAFKLNTSLAKTALPKSHRGMRIIFFITLATLVAALLALYFTYEDSISWAACRLGLYDRHIGPAALLIEGAVFFYWALRQPHSLASTFSTVKPFIYAVLMSNVIASIIFWRSLLLCTV